MEQKTKEQIYNEVTLRHLANNPHGTRMDIVYDVMDQWGFQQTHLLKERVAELEEGLKKIVKGPMNGDRNEYSEHVVSIANRLLSPNIESNK